MPTDSKTTLLVLGLSQAEHLKDEITEEIEIVYAGPRFYTDDLHYRTCNSPKTSDIISYYRSRGRCISGIILYADIFSLALFRPVYDSFDLNVICVVGDTHHGHQPITRLAKWLINSNIRAIALKQTIHHSNVFREIGFDVVNLPYYANDVRLIKPTAHYFQRLVFVGSLGIHHAKRRRLINSLISMGAPIDVQTLPRHNTFLAYNAYACSFNMPLNNDINYRIWEVMAAGGVCLTEKFSGDINKTDILAQDMISVVTYIDAGDCYNKLLYILSNVDVRMRIATNAYHAIKAAKESSSNLRIIANALLGAQAKASCSHFLEDYSESGMVNAIQIEIDQQYLLSGD